MKPTYDELMDMRRFLVEQSDEYVKELEIYCSKSLFRSENKSSNEYEDSLVHANSNTRDLIVYLEHNPIAFSWFVGKSRFVSDTWVGIPNEVLYRIPKIHGFLNMGILEDTHALVRFERPILRPIPISIGEPLYSWNVGCVVLNNSFSRKEK